MQAEVAGPVVVSEPCVVEAVIITVERQQLTRVGEDCRRRTRERERGRGGTQSHRESERGVFLMFDLRLQMKHLLAALNPAYQRLRAAGPINVILKGRQFPVVILWT